MKKFEEELNYLIELSDKVLTGQIEAEEFENHRVLFIKEQQAKIDELMEKMRELSQENESLKAQLEKQKVELPEFVAREFKKLEASDNKMKTIGRLRFWIGETVYDIDEEVRDWVSNNEKTILRAMLYGYTVKEKLFFLKNKLTGGYIAQDCYNGTRETYNCYDRTAFTQAEIDSMDTGSYEQIEVEG